MSNQNNEYEIHVLDYINVLVRARWTIFRHFVLTCFLVAVVSFIMPQKFTAVTTLMPPPDQSSSPFSSLMNDVSSLGLNLPGESATSDLLVEILKSRSVWNRVLAQPFTLQDENKPLWELLDFKNMEKARIGLGKKVGFVANEQGIISIGVTVGDRQLAANVANAFAQALDDVNQAKSVSRAKNSRLYIESQLQETKTKLIDATEKLAAFQQEHKAVSLEAQMQTSIEQAAQLKAIITAKEVELGVLMQSMKAQNPQVQRRQQEIDELQNRYKQMQYGGKNAGYEEFYLPFADVPEVALQLAELMREAKVQETVWELLNQQFYQAKIEEARNTPTVQVLDVAVPPLLRSSPKRKMMVIVFGLLAILLSAIWAFVQEYVYRVQELPEEQKRLQPMQNALSEDKAKFAKIFKRGEK